MSTEVELTTSEIIAKIEAGETISATFRSNEQADAFANRILSSLYKFRAQSKSIMTIDFESVSRTCDRNPDAGTVTVILKLAPRAIATYKVTVTAANLPKASNGDTVQ